MAGAPTPAAAGTVPGQPPRAVSAADLALLAARPELRTYGACLLVAVVATVVGASQGWLGTSVQLYLAAVLAAAGMFQAARALYARAARQQGGAGFLYAALPYLSGVYLALVKGLWGLVRSGGHLGAILLALLLLYLGYRIVRRTYELTALERAISEGRLEVIADPPRARA